MLGLCCFCTARMSHLLARHAVTGLSTVNVLWLNSNARSTAVFPVALVRLESDDRISAVLRRPYFGRTRVALEWPEPYGWNLAV